MKGTCWMAALLALSLLAAAGCRAGNREVEGWTANVGVVSLEQGSTDGVQVRKGFEEGIQVVPAGANARLKRSEAIPAAHDPFLNPRLTEVSASVIYSGPEKIKKAALTFDDGPDGKFTPMILDVLKKHHIKATFFVLGQQVEEYPDVAARIYEEGHILGNHTYSHINITKWDAAKIKSQINRTDEAVKKITGEETIYFRPPYGAVSKEALEAVAATKHRIVGWCVDTRDWEGKSPKEIIAAVKRELKPGAILLQHSAGGKKGDLNNTVEALEQIISYLNEQHYEFVTIPELLENKKGI